MHLSVLYGHSRQWARSEAHINPAISVDTSAIGPDHVRTNRRIKNRGGMPMIAWPRLVPRLLAVLAGALLPTAVPAAEMVLTNEVAATHFKSKDMEAFARDV